LAFGVKALVSGVVPAFGGRFATLISLCENAFVYVGVSACLFRLLFRTAGLSSEQFGDLRARFANARAVLSRRPAEVSGLR
jgi:hypothetical protein